MVIGRHNLVNKRAVIFNMSGRDIQYEKLLAGLSVQELSILRKYPELQDDAKEIAHLTLDKALWELSEEYDLEIDEYNSQDMFISVEKLEDAVPDWFETSHCGWYKGKDKDELLNWAKELLMQEVRINIWIKYCEYKVKPKPALSTGMYL